MELRISSVTFGTDWFQDMEYEEAEIVGHRILSLPFVESIDWLHGTIEVLYGKLSVEEMRAELEKHLRTPIASGEHVQEIFHEYGNQVYTYEYHKGEYNG